METISYDIGPRVPASKEMGRAQKLLADDLSSIGAVNVHSETVPVLAWSGGNSLLQVISPYSRTCNSIQHIHTHSATVTAPLLDGGRCSESELGRLKHKVKNSILLIQGQEICGGKHEPVAMRVRRAADLGAAAVLVRNAYPGIGPATGLMGVASDMPLPVLGISREDGCELASLIRRGRTQVKLETNGNSFSAECANLIADLDPGSSEEVIVLSAHLDSMCNAPGSFDNLTGVIALVEIARALSPFITRFTRTLRLILFTAEEYGHVGSRAYVEKNAEELNHIQFVFNMDSLCHSTSQGVAVMWSRNMCEFIKASFEQTQSAVDVRNLFCMSSDYFPFMLSGIPAARPADWKGEFPVHSHTVMDTPDKVPLEWIRLNAMTYAQMLLYMLIYPTSLPVQRLKEAEVHNLVKEEGIEEVLRFRGMSG